MESHIGEIYALLNAVTWGAAVILFRRCGDFTSPLALNLFKNCVALLLFVVTILVFNIKFFPNVTYLDYTLLFLSGIFGLAISDTLLFKSLNTIGASNWAIIDCLYSPLLIVLGYLMLQEKLSIWDLVGGALVISSTLMVSRAQVQRFSSVKVAVISIIVAVLAVFTNAFSLVLAKPVLVKTSLIWATTVRLFAGLIPLVVLALVSRRHWCLWSSFKPKRDWQLLIPATIMGNYVALVLWIGGMKYAHVGVAGILNKLSTVTIIVLSVIFLKERLTLVRATAALLGIVGAVLVIYY